MASISISGVTKTFGAVTALDNVSIDIPSGAFVSLLGPSGCGKTTLLRLIAGLETVTRGRILIGARDVTNLPPEQRELGMMFQSYALFPHMSVRENVRFPLRMRKIGSKAEQFQRAEDALELMQLGGMGDRQPRSMSGGQQQRVALARALVAEPQVLLLDEALSNLDARLREEMQIELKELHKKLGITTLFVTHDQSEALSLSDCVVLMRDGKVEQIGEPTWLYEQPRNVFAADFVGAANLIPVDVKLRDGHWVAELDGGAVVPCIPPPDHAQGRYILSLRQEDIWISPEPPEPGQPGILVEIITTVYFGDRNRSVIEIDGTRIKCLSASSRRPVSGKQILKWDMQRGRLLRE